MMRPTPRPESRLEVAARALAFALALASFGLAPPVRSQESGALPAGADATQTADERDEAAARAERAAEIAERLHEIEGSIEARRAEIQALQESEPGAGAAEHLASEADVEARVAELQGELSGLRRTFEELATDGVDKRLFEAATPEAFDWQAELIEISKPIFDELRGLTEKPRQIEKLKRDIARAQAQRDAARRAVAALRALDRSTFSERAGERIARLEEQWTQRGADVENAIEVATLKLDNLVNDQQPLWDRAKTRAGDFVRGRGLTLVLAGAAALLAWFVMRLVLRSLERRLRRSGERRASTRHRLILYGHRLFSIVVVVVAVVTVFSVMGDFLLLAIAIVAIVFTLVSLRRMLPDYVAEAKLLLGVGAVREGERIVYDGLPYEVKSINVYSVLRNPLLEGIVRLPIRELVGRTSRPCKEEPWFPTRTGDYVLMPDDGFGQVLRQTPEVVQLGVLGGMTQIHPSASFAASGLRNICGGETYIVVVTFGIDYAHQAISQTDVTPKLAEALDTGLRAAPFGDAMAGLLVDFKAAAASSLDYLVVVTMKSSAAGSYYGVGRKVQQICVETCNREAWGIPFAQLTVHQGDGFDALRAQPAAKDAA